MFKHTGGETVRQGFYWNADKWAVTLVQHQGGTLPGEATERYAKVPVFAMLLVAPIMGALYVLFLPCIGVAMVLDYAARRVAAAIKDGALALLASIAPQWRPGEAYLAERKRRKAAKKAKETEKKDETK